MRWAGTLLPIVLHVATVNGAPVVPQSFIEAQLARANEIFAPYGVSFAIEAQVELAERHARQRSRRDRDRLRTEVRAGAIHCFIVAELLDVDEPGRVRRGVHWHARDRPRSRYVILSAIAGPNVLAHELGHYLGNREHSPVRGNLMSYEHGDQLPVLDAAQQERLSRALRASLASGELRQAAPAMR